jgi:ABC-type polysaccharide/polyol phosphate export permease
MARGTYSMVENANLIQKTYFPTEILTTKAVMAPFVSYGTAIVLLTLYVLVFHLSWGVLLILPFMLALQFFFTLGISFLTATISVFFRDVIQLVHIIISFWVFVTPVFYPVGMLPEWAKKAMYANPLYPFTSTYQSLFVHGSVGQWHMILLALGWSLTFFVAGAFLFNKLKYEFADWL